MTIPMWYPSQRDWSFPIHAQHEKKKNLKAQIIAKPIDINTLGN